MVGLCCTRTLCEGGFTHAAHVASRRAGTCRPSVGGGVPSWPAQVGRLGSGALSCFVRRSGPRLTRASLLAGMHKPCRKPFGWNAPGHRPEKWLVPSHHKDLLRPALPLCFCSICLILFKLVFLVALILRPSTPCPALPVWGAWIFFFLCITKSTYGLTRSVCMDRSKQPLLFKVKITHMSNFAVCWM